MAGISQVSELARIASLETLKDVNPEAEEPFVVITET
jgi:hypothetical protein